MNKKLLCALLSITVTAVLLAGCGGGRKDDPAVTTEEAASDGPTAEQPETTSSVATAESEDYTGEIIDYPDKELWFRSDLYGGSMNAYTIVKGNGDDTFDIDAFINSELGQLTLERIKDELCLRGDTQWGSEEVISEWAEQGVIEEIHRQGGTADDIDPTDKENIKDVYLTFVPDYMMEAGNEQTYPLVIDYHGAGGSLYESINHGFVHICYDNQFMVVCPEVNGTEAAYAEEHLEGLITELIDQGYPIDRSRIYLVGQSKGGIAAMYVSLLHSDLIGAIAVSGCSGYFDETGETGMSFDTELTQDMYDSADQVPMYMQIGSCDHNQYPFGSGVLRGANRWIAFNGCAAATAADNIFGFEGGQIYEEALDGTTYTFEDFTDANGNAVVRFASVEGLPHWISPSYALLSWEFLSRFSRGADGTLVIQ